MNPLFSAARSPCSCHTPIIPNTSLFPRSGRNFFSPISFFPDVAPKPASVEPAPLAWPVSHDPGQQRQGLFPRPASVSPLFQFTPSLPWTDFIEATPRRVRPTKSIKNTFFHVCREAWHPSFGQHWSACDDSSSQETGLFPKLEVSFH